MLRLNKRYREDALIVPANTCGSEGIQVLDLTEMPCQEPLFGYP